ncbi:hypothetical protein [Ekhidna sp.]|uniref:hypothetical protein n=1 Tax=Ekhidna sp. TaxID=2608089 RepID=UPI003B50E0ED
MKHFLFRLGIISGLAAFLIILAILVPIIIIDSKAEFVLPKSTENLILGTSRSECSFNDSLITNTINFAHSAESYYYSYLKLKKLLEYNEGIRNVFIEFSTYLISDRMDSRIWGDKYLNWRYPNYSSFMNHQDLQVIARNNWKGLLIIQSLSARNNINYVLTSLPDPLLYFDWGGYLYLERNKTDSLLKMLSKQPIEKRSYNISAVNQEYLIKIINLCREKKVGVIFVRPPIHAKFPHIDENVWTTKNNCELLASIEYLDFKDFPLLNSDFGDLEHLNHRGARKFSHFFNILLEEGLLEQDDKQGFIHSSIRNELGD